MQKLAKLLVLVTTLIPGRARAARLWDGDASKGTAVFGEVQSFNGPITVVDDPTFGKVFKIVCNDNGDTKARSEVSYMEGVTLARDGDYYIAWRSKWGPLPTKSGKWQVLSQIHHDPVGLGGPVPFGLSVPGDGMMHFNAQDPTGRSYSMWDHALPLDSWHRYIVHTKMGETLDTGFCEIWFDGVKQKLTNGMEKIPCAMARPNAGSHWKWGVYRSGAGGPIGQSVHYLQHPMLGTTLEDVADDGNGGGGSGSSDGGATPPPDAAPAADDAAVDVADAGGAPPDPETSTSGGAPPPAPAPASAARHGGCAVATVGATRWPLLLVAALLVLRRRRR